MMAQWWNLYFDVAEFLHKRCELNLNHKSCDFVDKVPSYKALDKNTPYLAWIVCPIRTESHPWARTLEITNTPADTHSHIQLGREDTIFKSKKRWGFWSLVWFNLIQWSNFMLTICNHVWNWILESQCLHLEHNVLEDSDTDDSN